MSRRGGSTSVDSVVRPYPKKMTESGLAGGLESGLAAEASGWYSTLLWVLMLAAAVKILAGPTSRIPSYIRFWRRILESGHLHPAHLVAKIVTADLFRYKSLGLRNGEFYMNRTGTAPDASMLLCKPNQG